MEWKKTFKSKIWDLNPLLFLNAYKVQATSTKGAADWNQIVFRPLISRAQAVGIEEAGPGHTLTTLTSGWTRVDSLWPPPLPWSKKVEALKFLAWSDKQDFGGGFLRNGNIWLVLPFQCRWELITKLLTAAFNKFCVAFVRQFQFRMLNYCIWISIHYSS